MTTPNKTRFPIILLVLHVLKHFWHRIWHARLAVVSVVIGILAMCSPVIQDLYFEPMNWLGRIFFALTVLFLWSIPVHRAARAGIDSMPMDTLGVLDSGLDRKLIHRIRWCGQLIDTWLPRLLGLSTLALMIAVIAYLMFNLRGLEGLSAEHDATMGQLAWAGIVLILSFLGYVIYLWSRRTLRRTNKLTHDPWRRGERMTFWQRVGFVHTLVSIGFFLWAFFGPLEFTGIIGRISLLPVLLGSPLPPLSPAAVAGNRWRTPLILFGVIAFIFISAVNSAFHDVRLFDSGKTAATRLASVDDAITAWMVENGCADNAPACPTAILVAASGGGSRAAFFTATALGQLLDDSADKAKPGRQLFAISGVSGGAVGAAIVRAALGDGTDGTPPCINKSKLWFGAGVDTAGKWTGPKSWKDCLQNLASGDLLSAPITGLAYRDYLWTWGLGDRNELLEQALEQNYNYVTLDQPAPCGNDVNARSYDRGLCRPLGYRLPAAAATPWVPLLLLNTTSVERGSRIVASDLDVSRMALPNTLDLFQLLGSTSPPEKNKPAKPLNFPRSEDVRLSTASVLSGRFPVVLTAANLPNRSRDIAARVVDGGYFDNSGVGVLAPILRKLDERGIRTMTLILDNEPISSEQAPISTLPGSTVPATEPSLWERASALLFEPLLTLERIRAARAVEAITSYNEQWATLRYPAQAEVTYLRVFDAVAPNPCTGSKTSLKIDNVVVSWWLSPIGQLFVDKQLCTLRNANTLDQLRLKLAPPTSP